MTASESAISDLDPVAFKRLSDEKPHLATGSVPSSPLKLEVKDGYPDLSRPIHFCSFSGRKALLEILLDFSVALEAIAFEENKGLTTALVLAARRGFLTSCYLLLEAGANPTIPARPQKACSTPQPSITPVTKWTCFSLTVPNTMSSPRRSVDGLILSKLRYEPIHC